MSLEDEARPSVSQLRHVRTWAHPVRIRMLSLLTGADLSAAEVARELDITQANASYHLRRLAEAGEIEVAGTERVRGGMAKKYRYVSGLERDQQPPKRAMNRQQQTAALKLAMAVMAQETARRAEFVAEGKKLSSDAEVWVEPQVWERVLELITEASTLVHENAVPPRSEGAQRVAFLAMLFPMESGDGEH